jgi:hypothetical protein
LAPQTRVAAAAVTAPRKNLRVVELDTDNLLPGADYNRGAGIPRGTAQIGEDQVHGI